MTCDRCKQPLVPRLAHRLTLLRNGVAYGEPWHACSARCADALHPQMTKLLDEARGLSTENMRSEWTILRGWMPR